jgi:hypothetical protein
VLTGCAGVGFRYAYPSDFNPADYLLLVVSFDLEAAPEAERERMGRIVTEFQGSPLNTASSIPPTRA